MDKLKMHTQDVADENIEKIGQLFPNCLTERVVGKDKDGNDIIGRGIDFDRLKQELSKEIVEGAQERYQFTWPGKREAMRLANTPSNMTLRPDRESSVDFDNTENLYIEGDNLEVLKLLRENYLGKVKMIYIDPPYNTGNDFVYEDDFSQTTGEFKDRSGMFDENGNMVLDRFSVNYESNGRFHTDWLNMMYPRLKIARDLLTEDGVIFISIDDNEVDNLRKVCDEVFGAQNFVAMIIWQHSIQPKGYSDKFSVHHNYLMMIRKSQAYSVVPMKRTDEDNTSYSNPDNDPKGPWRSGDVRNALYRPNLIYDIVSPSGKIIKPCNNGWRWSKETLLSKIQTGEIIFSKDETRIIRKIYLSSVEGRAPETIWFAKDVGSTRDAMAQIKALFDNPPFDTPKPVGLVKKMTELIAGDDYFALDFFSGSATTAHAVMQLNAEDGGHRKFILVQIPEKTDEKSEAFKAGYPTICEIGKERIRRAGKKILDDIAAKQPENDIFNQGENARTLDTGFRVLKLDTSNMQDVYYKPEDSSDATLFEDNVKPDRTAEDLLFQVMLECNLPLSAKIEKKTISGKEVFNVNDGYLLACFDEDVNETVITEVAKQKPYYFIMRDKSLSSDNVADNFEQIFNAYSKDTIRKIL